MVGMASDLTLDTTSSMEEWEAQLGAGRAARDGEQVRAMRMELGQDQIRAMRVAFTREAKTMQAALTEIRRDRNLLSPAYTVPNDVWFHILELAFLHPFPVTQIDHVSWTDLPIAFSHVSRGFRQIALALPSIWTNIHVSASHKETFLEIVRLQLCRSGNMPLSIWFVCHPYGIPDESTYPPDSDVPLEYSVYFTRCWKLALPHMRRWRSLVLHGFTPMWRDGTFVKSTAVTFLEDLRSGCCSQLKYLDIYMHTSCHPPDRREHLNFMMKPFEAPLLSDLRICGLVLNPSSKFKNLRRLVLYSKSVALRTAKNVLRSVADTLTTLVLQSMDMQGDIAEAQSDPVQLPRLRSLYVVAPVIDDHCHLLVIAILPGAPKLRTLRLAGMTFSHWGILCESEPIIRGLLVFSTIKELRVGAPQFGSYNHDKCDHFPAVEHILLEERAEGFLRSVLWCLENPDLRNPFPSLKKLSLCELTDSYTLMELIAQLNAKIGRPLEEIMLDFELEEELDPQIVARLKGCIPIVRFGTIGRGKVDRNWEFDWD